MYPAQHVDKIVAGILLVGQAIVAVVFVREALLIYPWLAAAATHSTNNQRQAERAPSRMRVAHVLCSVDDELRDVCHCPGI